MAGLEDESAIRELQPRISHLKLQAEKTQEDVRIIRTTIASAQSSLIVLRQRLREVGVPDGEKAVMNDLGLPFLAAAEQLADLAQEIAVGLEVSFEMLKPQLESAIARSDARQGAAALTVAEKEIAALRERLALEGQPILNVALSLEVQLAALSLGPEG